MTIAEWKATQAEQDTLRLVKLALTKPVVGSTPQADAQIERPPLDGMALNYLKAIRTEIGAAWKADTAPADIKRDLDAWVAAAANAAGSIARVNKLLPFWACYYAVQDFDAAETVSVPQPDVIQYGQSPAEANGWTEFLAASNERKYWLIGGAE
jgi:hypothetical protein